MNQIVTKAIVLSRTNFGEADRIVTFLTPEQGKVRLIAKGVRKPKSKLAGGIELFSVSDITYMPGKGDIGRLVSSRLDRHYAVIAADVDRTMLAYELIKQLNKITEDQAEASYFTLLEQLFEVLSSQMSPQLVELWFSAQLLAVSGHTPNLSQDIRGDKLEQSKRYVFSFDDACCAENQQGQLGASEIKFARLVFGIREPLQLLRVADVTAQVDVLLPLVRQMRRSYLLQ